MPRNRSPKVPQAWAVLRRCRDMETRAPRTEATVSVVAGRGNPRVSRNWVVSVVPQKNGNPRAPRDPGGGFRRAVTWKLEVPATWAAVSVTLRHGPPKYPVLGVAVSIAAGHGNPRFPRLGEIFRRATKWKPLVSPNWGGCPSCGEMEAGLYAPRHGKKDTWSSQRLGSAVSKHHQFPGLGRRFPSSWKPRVSSVA